MHAHHATRRAKVDAGRRRWVEKGRGECNRGRLASVCSHGDPISGLSFQEERHDEVELRVQELWSRLQMRGPGPKGRRVLLRPRMHLRSELRLPGFVRLRHGQEEVAMTRADRPTSPPSGAALARDLLRMLAERRPRFLAFLRRRTISAADAEDLLQQGLLKAAEHVGDLRAEERLEAWFYRVLRNVVADHRAAAARSQAQLEAVAQELAPDATLATDTGCACSLGILEGLRPEYAEILRCVDIPGTDLEEAATTLGIARNNAKVRLHRARKAMRTALLGTCGTSSMRACHSCSCASPSPVVPAP